MSQKLQMNTLAATVFQFIIYPHSLCIYAILNPFFTAELSFTESVVFKAVFKIFNRQINTLWLVSYTHHLSKYHLILQVGKKHTICRSL